MKKIIIAVWILILAMCNIAWSQNINRAGTSAAQFLKFGVGARASALGEAAVSISTDVTGLYWNPAGIAHIGKTSMVVSINELYTDLSYNFLGLVYPLTTNSAVGLSVIFLDSGTMEVTTLENPQGTGAYFSWESLCIGISYSRFVTDRLSLGGTVKYIREGAYSQKAHTLAIDIGSLLDTKVLGMKLGMSLSNFGWDMQLGGSSLGITHDWNNSNSDDVSSEAFLATNKWSLPLIFRLGLSMQLVGTEGQLLKSDISKMIIAADTFDPNDALLKSNLGVEYEWNNILALRAGYRGVSLERDDYNSYITSSYTLGTGIKYKFDFANMQFDYAFTDYKILGNGHQLTLLFSF